ncbi:MAG: hypothetical protein NTV22_12590 [bacterium]|nr:hypothetical protein [bacterium]
MKPTPAYGYATRFGAFTPDHAYHITSRPPAPWSVFLWNDHFVSAIDTAGRGTATFKDAAHHRTQLRRAQTPRKVFVRDCATGAWWDMLDWEPDGEVIVRRGSIEFHRRPRGLHLVLTIVVPRAAPVELWCVRIENTTRRARRLRVFAANHLDLGGFTTRFGNWYSTPGAFDRAANGMVFYCKSLERQHAAHNGFLMTDGLVSGYDGLEAAFIGHGSWDRPDAVVNGRCANTAECGDERFLAALATDTAVAGGSMAEVHFMTGVFAKRREALALRRKYLMPRGAVARACTAVAAHWAAACSAVQVELPDQAMARIANYWLPYQLLLNAAWTRIYSHGFRDTLQDAEGVCALDPGRARRNIEQALQHQYASGRCVRSWGGVAAALKDEFYADSPMWIARSVVAYLKETGDIAFLEQRLPFRAQEPAGAQCASATVAEHVRRALRFLFQDRGARGLVRIHHGDWCDTMHQVGVQGRGESVWLSIATVQALKCWAELATFMGDRREARACRRMAATLTAAIKKHGWDGGWYRAAINDDDQWIGAARNRWGKVFLNPQTWSVLAGINTAERNQQLFSVIEKNMDGYLGPQLLWPAYRDEVRGIGALTGFGPGAVENGSVYNHAVCFLIAAYCATGRGDDAYRLWSTIMPGGGADSSSRNQNACAEPFAFTNCRIGYEHATLAGRGNAGAWATGTAAWAFLTLVEGMLGVQHDFDGLRIAPCLPRHWRKVRVRRVFRGATYAIVIHNPRGVSTGVTSVHLDGQRLRTALVPALGAGATHHVDVRMG